MVRAGALGQPALLVLLLAIGLVAARALWFARSEDAGLTWALVATGTGLGLVSPGMTGVWLATAALVLVVATVEASYGMAYGDELTGMSSRRSLDSELRQLDGSYTIAMVDVDHFKKFNDEHGHPVGDQLLRMVAARLARVRAGGRAFRYGGEEFAILFPGKDLADVLDELETVRGAIEASPFVVRRADRPRKKPDRPVRGTGAGRRRVGVTVSIGVASASRRANEPRAVLDAADAALYRAKHGGRNRISV
jgi:diguanylate cyclase (GGDEF)-like protein